MNFINPDVVEKCRNLFEDVRHEQMTNAEYHASDWKSLSKTRLTVVKNDPQEFYQRWITHEMRDTDTEALLFGRIFHEMVLEKVGSVDETNWSCGTLGVFRPYRVPRREPDIVKPGEELWIEDTINPGITRRSAEWGNMDDRSWILAPDTPGVTTAFCGFADMHKDGELFRHVPDSVLSDSGKRQGKAWLDFAKKHKGETFFKASDWYKALSMRRRLRQHGDANRCLFQGGVPEHTLVGKCVDTGLEIRTRLDYYKPIDGGVLITDLKTSRDADPAIWNRQADKDGLNMQAAIQIGMASHAFAEEDSDGEIEYGGIAFRFATCDKSAPFRPETFEIEDEFLEMGCSDYLKTSRIFQQCVDSNVWLHDGFGEPVKLVTPLSKMVQWS